MTVLADVGIGMGEKLFVRAESGEMLKPGPSDPWAEKPGVTAPLPR